MTVNKLSCGLAAFVLASAPALADDWFIEAHYQTPAQVRAIAGEFQHLIIDEKRQMIRVDTDEAGIHRLEDAGMSVTVDMAATAQMRVSDRAMVKGPGIESIPGFACYRTVEETYTTIDDLVSSHPNLASVEDIGPTWQRTQNAAQGYQMRALRITNLGTAASDPDRPKMVAFGSIHAREYTPAELLTRMAEWLVNGYGTDAQATWLVDHVDFRFVLEANPDGRKKAESGILWRKNTNTADGFCATAPTGNSHSGIDLNRNFPFHWSTVANGSSGTKCSATFRGPIAGSEPETQNLVRYVAGTPGGDGTYSGGVLPDRRADGNAFPAPDDYAGLFFDVHSYSKLVLWPWGDTATPSGNAEAFTSIGRRIAFFNDYTPKQSVGLYPTDGTTVDTIYGLLGTPSFTIELGNQFFEPCAAFEDTILPANLAALKYAARVAWRPYQLPLGPDVTLIRPIIRVDQGTPVTLNANIDELGYKLVAIDPQPTFPITAANAFIDHAPWDASAAAIALQPSDGTFDSKVEWVNGSIDTSDLAVGRHLVYVQGVNSQTSGGRAGAPDAIFLDVLPVGDSIYFSGADSL